MRKIMLLGLAITMFMAAQLRSPSSTGVPGDQNTLEEPQGDCSACDSEHAEESEPGGVDHQGIELLAREMEQLRSTLETVQVELKKQQDSHTRGIGKLENDIGKLEKEVEDGFSEAREQREDLNKQIKSNEDALDSVREALEDKQGNLLVFHAEGQEIPGKKFEPKNNMKWHKVCSCSLDLEVRSKVVVLYSLCAEVYTTNGQDPDNAGMNFPRAHFFARVSNTTDDTSMAGTQVQLQLNHQDPTDAKSDQNLSSTAVTSLAPGKHTLELQVTWNQNRWSVLGGDSRPNLVVIAIPARQ